jgi:hypothetical protein
VGKNPGGGGGGGGDGGDSSSNIDNGYLMLDYHWQRNMGDLHFNREAFPNINETLQLIR